MDLKYTIEAILFLRGEPVAYATLAKLTQQTESAVREAVSALAKERTGGVRVIHTDTEAQLATAPELGNLLAELSKEELSRDLGRAGAETLAIILYRYPIGRAEIDHIRGVNSTFILRNLLIRGLVERIANPKDQRSFLYQPTTDLLRHLGVTSVEELPDHAHVRESLEAFLEAPAEEEA